MFMRDHEVNNYCPGEEKKQPVIAIRITCKH